MGWNPIEGPHFTPRFVGLLQFRYLMHNKIWKSCRKHLVWIPFKALILVHALLDSSGLAWKIDQITYRAITEFQWRWGGKNLLCWLTSEASSQTKRFKPYLRFVGLYPGIAVHWEWHLHEMDFISRNNAHNFNWRGYSIQVIRFESIHSHILYSELLAAYIFLEQVERSAQVSYLGSPLRLRFTLGNSRLQRDLHALSLSLNH